MKIKLTIEVELLENFHIPNSLPHGTDRGVIEENGSKIENH